MLVGRESSEEMTLMRRMSTNNERYVEIITKNQSKFYLVPELESGDFSSWQGSQGIARRRTTVRRTSKAED